MVNNEIFILMIGIRNQNSPSDERTEWDEYGRYPMDGFDTSELEGAVHSARATNSSSVRLNKHEFEGSNV